MKDSYNLNNQNFLFDPLPSSSDIEDDYETEEFTGLEYDVLYGASRSDTGAAFPDDIVYDDEEETEEEETD